jgi:hypothetical protein
LSAAIDSVSATIAEYARLLNLEHSSENVRLNTRELTLQFSPLSGRTDFLWEVGSGQNWVGYHIAGLLALHVHFIRLSQSPVPRFLMIDQPSQVYFPKRVVTRLGDKFEEPSFQDEDVVAVHKAFEVMAKVVLKAKGKLQIIVLDHASRDVWGDIPGIVGLRDWRNGIALVPKKWLDKNEDNEIDEN